jgi:nitrogenase molybdenum-iron protein beta chain
MSYIDAPRVTCALGGALDLVNSIHRAVPIIHAGPGCGMALFTGNLGHGYQYEGYACGYAMPSTNTLEKQVVFGGEDRLREQIKTTLEIIDADIYFVISGCTVGLIGDDIRAVVNEFSGSEKPVIFAETSGFKGDTYRGYDIAYKSMIDQLTVRSKKRTKGVVNLLGIVPLMDAFWQGNINEIVRLLQRIGLKVNLSGNGDTVDKIKNASKVELNIVLSPNTGIAVAEHFKQKFGVPYLVYPLPIGSETSNFLREVARALHLDLEKVEKVIEEEENTLWKYLLKFTEAHVFALSNKEFAVIADSGYAVGITKFLANDLSLSPGLIAVTDQPEENLREPIRENIGRLDYDLEPTVLFESDNYKIWENIKKNKPNVVFGSTNDKIEGKKYGISTFPLTFPLYDQVVLSKGYSGYRGAVTLAEELSTMLISGT